MQVSELIKILEMQEGNRNISCGGIYISPANVRKVVEYIDVDDEFGILFTPYLLTEEGCVYELHYYEFEVDIGNYELRYVEYNKHNCLPKEIVENLKPRIRERVEILDSLLK